MKDSYRNLQELDSMLQSRESNKEKMSGEGHKAIEARINAFVDDRIKAKKPFTDSDFPPTRESLYNTR